jgi:hypothetical protein
MIEWMILDPSKVTFFEISHLRRDGWDVLLENELLIVKRCADEVCV